MKLHPAARLGCFGVCAAINGCLLQSSPAAVEGRSFVSPLTHAPSTAATPSPKGYSVNQIRHAYGFDQLGVTGAGQTIAIIVAYGSPTLADDLAVFSKTYGLINPDLHIYYPQGKPAQGSATWALETTIDTEWAHAIAPGASLAVVVAPSNSTDNLLRAIDYAVRLGAKQISMSWSSPESSDSISLEAHFNKQGVTFVAAAGDSGAAVRWPAVSAYVVGVGGTSLVIDRFDAVTSELAWSKSGGGVSKYIPMPAYQKGWNPYKKRGVPDVSYSADPAHGFPVYISNYNQSTGWLNVGGTSCGAPQWAALFALANSGRLTSLHHVNTTLYALDQTAYTGDYRDIVTGGNGGYDASILYDFVTGLGSPVALKIVNFLIASVQPR